MAYLINLAIDDAAGSRKKLYPAVIVCDGRRFEGCCNRQGEARLLDEGQVLAAEARTGGSLWKARTVFYIEGREVAVLAAGGFLHLRTIFRYGERQEPFRLGRRDLVLPSLGFRLMPFDGEHDLTAEVVERQNVPLAAIVTYHVWLRRSLIGNMG